MIHLKMLLQENGAAREVINGKIFHLVQDIFHKEIRIWKWDVWLELGIKIGIKDWN